jgi:hypothetical protein
MASEAWRLELDEARSWPTRGPAAAAPGAPRPLPKVDTIRLTDVLELAATKRAVEAAAQRLEDPSCQTVLDDFGLRGALEASGRSAPDLRTLFLYDAPARSCGGDGTLAVTSPGRHGEKLVPRAGHRRQSSRKHGPTAPFAITASGEATAGPRPYR